MRTSARAVLVSALLGTACGGSTSEAASSDQAAGRRPSTPAGRDASPPALRAAELARVPSRTFGPYLSQSPKASVVVWAAFDGKTGSFSALPVSSRGKPRGKPRAVAQVSENLRLVAVRPSEPGFIVVHTELAKEGESVSALCLNAQGEALGSPTLLTTVMGRAMWLEVVPVQNGSLVFFGNLPDETKLAVEIGVVPLDAKCRAAERSLVMRDAQAWQVVRSGTGAMLTTVSASGAGGFGNIDAVSVDADGKSGAAVAVSRDGSADADLDAIRIGEAVVLAWTDRRSIEPRLFSATLDASGKVTVAPHPLTSPEGEQALLQLVAPADGSKTAYAAWENLSERRPPGERIFQLAALDEQGKLQGARALLEYASLDGLAPELSATRRGLAALTIAPLCAKGARCDGSRTAPTFVEVDQALSPIAVEPLRLDALGGVAAEHGFNLSCTASGCVGMAALRREPAPVYTAELEARSTLFRSPVRRVDTSKTPRVLTLEALSSVQSCAAFALETAGEQEFLATITDFDPTTPWRRLDKPAPDGRFEPLRARIALERLSSGPKGSEQLRASPISIRAHSLGGVTLARGNPDRGELLVAWAGVDQGVPQIFLTLISKSGDRLAQKMLTRKKGELGDIAATSVGDGWLVAWVDERHGDLEVFAAKVDLGLNRVGVEQRITEVPGAAADPALAFDGTAAALVWSDARSSEDPGHADVFGVALSPRDASRQGPELRLATTRAHSFSPSIQAYAGGFAVVWAERGQGEGDAGAIEFVRIAADRTLSSPVSIGTGDAEPRSVALACRESDCRLSAILERANEATLAIAAVSAKSTPQAVAPVLSLLGAAGAAVPPLMRGDDVTFVDADGKRAIVRRARLAW